MERMTARKAEGLYIHDGYEGRNEDKQKLRLRLEQEPMVKQLQ